MLLNKVVQVIPEYFNYKQRKYELLKDRFIVQSVRFETLGSCGPAARTFLSDIGRRIEQATGRERWVFGSNLVQFNLKKLPHR